MTCGDIIKFLKRFQDDLLLEEEYQAFITHVNQCVQCRGYVRSVGSFSNQIWELGDVKVPDDLTSTIIFKLRNPPSQKMPDKKQVMPLGLWIGSLGSILAAVLVFWSVSHFLMKSKSSDPSGGYISNQWVEMPETSQTETPVADETMEDISEAPDIEVFGNAVVSPPAESMPRVLSTRPLHWHFRWPQASQLCRGAECRASLERLLLTLGLRLDYDSRSLMIFTATGDKAEQVLKWILSLDEGNASFRDFTESVETLPKNLYRVCLYLGQDETGFLHWDIAHASSAKKLRLFEEIKKISSSIGFRSEECLIFSSPLSGIDELRRTVRAMRISLEEFDSPQVKGQVLESKPVTVSVYFSE